MAQRSALKKLLRLRELEEQQIRLELERVVRERNAMAAAISQVTETHGKARRSLALSVASGDRVEFNGAAIEMEAGSRRRTRLEFLLGGAEEAVHQCREEYLSRRMARRQVETLEDRERAAQIEVAARRSQQMLDDWFARKAAPSTTLAESSGITAGTTPQDSQHPAVRSKAVSRLP